MRFSVLVLLLIIIISILVLLLCSYTDTNNTLYSELNFAVSVNCNNYLFSYKFLHLLHFYIFTHFNYIR